MVLNFVLTGVRVEGLLGPMFLSFSEGETEAWRDPGTAHC